ncbi:MAG: ribosome maturation factor RimP [Ignavibacteriales bacterium]|nr:ribosome maturation factor RimP [Ignavibacteriales bacterium]
MSDTIVEKIKVLAQPIIDRNDAFLVDLLIRGERTSKVVELYVDTDSGILLDQCSNISRELATILDESDIIQGRYRLDVSSPGLDRPLKLLRQYKKNIGRTCKIVSMEEGKKVAAEGVLDQVNENSVSILQKGKSVTIEFPHIIETYIIPKLK